MATITFPSGATAQANTERFSYFAAQVIGGRVVSLTSHTSKAAMARSIAWYRKLDGVAESTQTV